MIRFVILFVVLSAVAAGIAWFADRPGDVSISWLGYEIETSVMAMAAAILIVFAALGVLWAALRAVLGTPGAVLDYFRLRKQRRGLDALSKGMIAIGAGDARAAVRHAGEAGRLISSEPLVQLLKAQTAQIQGDSVRAVRVFEAMLQSRETELLGLRGLYIEAQRNNDPDLARGYAARASKINPALPWASGALLRLQSARRDWAGAEQTVRDEQKYKLISKPEASRKRAVLLTARAMEAEDSAPDEALELALRAHRLAGDLVPAAVLAGRLSPDRMSLRKANQVLEKTWKANPHPDLAEVYGDLQPGISPRQRLRRVKTLVRKGGGGEEGDIAIARAAIEARAWGEARGALADLVAHNPAVRVCTMMAEIEQGESGDEGRVREWLARAVRAPRDPAWIADGLVYEDWAPVSPVSGALDAFEWKVPARGQASAPREAITSTVSKRPERNQQAARQPSDGPEQKAATDSGGGKGPAPRETAGEKQTVFVAPRPPDDPGQDADPRRARRWYHALLPG